MKIKEVVESKSFYVDVETRNGVESYRRSADSNNWEKLYGDSWESLYGSDELESLFQEYQKANNKPIASEPKYGEVSFNYDTLPEPQNIGDFSNIYHVVKCENFGVMMAMYLRNDQGEVAWYSSYAERIVDKVIAWALIPR